MADSDAVERLLPLSPAVYHIMLSLAGGEMHGYAIMREVERTTRGQMRLGPGTLYRTIKQMLTTGIIEETEERPDPSLDDERRRYYRLTSFGRRVAQAESARLARLVVEARSRHLLDAGWEAGTPTPGMQGGLG